jgi:hypothetical protein
LDGVPLRQAAAALAALVARYHLLASWAREDRAAPSLDTWVRWARVVVAGGEQP